jgi:predicted amidohydrolase
MSTIANPKGEVILQSSKSGAETGVVDIDISEARDKYITPQNHILMDRKPSEYIHLTESRENEE